MILCKCELGDSKKCICITCSKNIFKNFYLCECEHFVKGIAPKGIIFDSIEDVKYPNKNETVETIIECVYYKKIGLDLLNTKTTYIRS